MDAHVLEAIWFFMWNIVLHLVSECSVVELVESVELVELVWLVWLDWLKWDSKQKMKAYCVHLKVQIKSKSI